MGRFADFIKNLDRLNEKALQIGDKSVAYPKFNNILVMGGGAANGKSFVLHNFINFEGKTFDVDALKVLFLKHKPKNLKDKFEKQTGRYIDSINMKDPGDVFLLHTFFKELGIQDKQIENFFSAALGTKNKPNVIFDVTLKDTSKLEEISDASELGGYDKKNIHIVWVLSDLKLSIEQNARRSRSVPMDILMKTNTGAAMSIKQILAETNTFRKYADGDIWIFFNKANIDNKLKVNDQKSFTVDFYTAFKLKSQGKAAIAPSELEEEIVKKIKSYVGIDFNERV